MHSVQLASFLAFAAFICGTAVSQVAIVDVHAAERKANVRYQRCEAKQNAASNTDGGSKGLHCHRWLMDTGTLPAIRVYADRRPSEPGTNSIITADQIVNTSADHPAEVLNTLPGMNIQMNSGQEHLLAVRSPVLTGGAGQGSFLILENGVPTRSPAFGNVNMLLEPHHEVAGAIEVIRGPGSAKYGSNAVHGLINVIMPDPDFGHKIRLSGSTLGRYKADLIRSGDLGRTSGFAALSFQHDIGWRDSSGTDQQKFSTSAQFNLSGWSIQPWLVAANLEQETAGFLQGPDAYQERDLAKTNPSPEAYRDAWSIRSAVRMQREDADGTLTLTPFARTQAMEFSQHFLPNGGVEENSHHAIGLMSRYERTVTDNLIWRIGGDLDFASGDLKETQLEPFGFFPGDMRFPVGVHYDYQVDTTVGAVWSELSWKVSDRFDLLAGLRTETHTYEYTTKIADGVNGRFHVPADRSDDFDFVTPKLGAIYQATSQLSLYANYARGNRAPQASDLYRLQSLQGVAEANVEKLDSFEVGARGSALNGDLVFDVAAYWMEKDTFFFRDANGLNVSDGSTRHQGIEAAFDWSFSDHWSVSGTTAWSDQVYTFDRVVGNSSETISSGNQIDTAPEWLADLSLTWSPIDKFEVSLTAEHVGEYFTNPANTRAYPGHTVAHFRGRYALTEAMDGFIIIRNLFDETYADRADFAFGSERYFPGEPLNLTIGIRQRFK